MQKEQTNETHLPTKSLTSDFNIIKQQKNFIPEYMRIHIYEYYEYGYQTSPPNGFSHH